MPICWVIILSNRRNIDGEKNNKRVDISIRDGRICLLNLVTNIIKEVWESMN